MSGKTRTLLLSLTLVASLIFSAVGTTTVFADDGITTGSSETNISTNGSTEQGDTSTTGEEQPTETVTTDTDQVDPPTTSEEQPTETGTTGTDQVDPSTTGEEPQVEVTTPILEQLPENTTVAVVDAAGEAQPLVSQQSADAVLLSDPIWCPEGQAPTPGANGCTASYSSFTELLDFLKANEGDAAYQQAGTIYVQQGAYLGGESSIDFNSYNFTNLNQHDLTIHGGWDTTDNSLDPADTSQFEVPIIIGSLSNPWVGSLTINNIFISGVNGQAGLTLYSQGDINLSNVEVTDSHNGANLNAGGNVTVKKSKFNNNGSGVTVDANGTDIAINPDATGSGLGINSGGAVTLQEVSANDNQLFGANIVATQTVTVTDSFFSGNISYAFPSVGNWEHYGYGLQVVTTQNIVLDNVNAIENQLFGANLDGVTVTISNSFFNNNKSVFDEDTVGYGLNVESGGNVTLQSVEANNNQLFGANIKAAGDVTVALGFFNGNASFEYVSNVKDYDGYGLQIVATGFINLSDITATGNYLFGAHLEGSSVAISTGIFSDNGTDSSLDLLGKGLEIANTDTVSLFDVEANNNQLFGASIQVTGNVAISDSFFSGNKVYSYSSKGTKTTAGGGYGLLVATSGNITLNAVEANNNYLYGAKLNGREVAITSGFFNMNGSDAIDRPVGSGLEIGSTGIVTLNSIEANNNQIFGVDIVTTGQVSINGGSFNNTQSLSHETATFYGYGLNVLTGANITLNDIVANNNYLWGASLTGLDVFITNGQFNFNVSPSSVFIDDTGLLVNSGGNVNLFNVETLENRLIGADITATGNVSITQGNFSDNQGITCSIAWCPPGSEIYHGYGLHVSTPGLIFLDQVTASGNYLFGAHLEGAGVFVSSSSFNNNVYGNGLIVEASGDVSLDNVTAMDNGENGVEVSSGSCTQVNGGTFTGNAQYGISVGSGNLNLDGTQTFAGNGAGNIFPNPLPSPCVVVSSASNPNTTTSTGTSNSTISSGSQTNASLSSNGNGNNTTIANGKNKKVKKHHQQARKHKVKRIRGYRR